MSGKPAPSRRLERAGQGYRYAISVVSPTTFGSPGGLCMKSAESGTGDTAAMVEVLNAIFAALVMSVLSLAVISGSAWIANLLFAL